MDPDFDPDAVTRYKRPEQKPHPWSLALLGRGLVPGVAIGMVAAGPPGPRAKTGWQQPAGSWHLGASWQRRARQR